MRLRDVLAIYYGEDLIDKILACKHEGHRLAIVKEVGELPENPYVGDARHWYDRGQQSMLKDYVQEVKE